MYRPRIDAVSKKTIPTWSESCGNERCLENKSSIIQRFSFPKKLKGIISSNFWGANFETSRIIVEARNLANELNQLIHFSTGFVTAGDADFFHLNSVQFLISEIKIVSKINSLISL